ncbi:MAG: DegT/DnrJ/EryC1/StrS family aminotransferase [Bacteroidales bacterium]|nr:DegT/DnrJ/EryC1/StrS family aminotransferase [Bacteroidales bacterium]
MKINIVKPFLPDIEEIKADFQECLSTGMVTNYSKHVRKYEEKLQEYFGSAKTPLAFCNGELALFSLIQAWKTVLGYGIYDSFEVLVPSFTFSGTINAVVMNNLRPVFCDVDETLTLDPTKLKADSTIKMIIAVGVYGNLPNIEKLGDFAKKNNLILLFDNAPAFGATYKNKFPAHYGYSEIYSFHATKIYNSMEGGAALTDNDEVHEYMSRIREFGQYEKVRGDIDIAGLNSKMQEISAIVGIKNLEKIDYILSLRKKNIEEYRKFFSGLENKGKIKLMKVSEKVFCPYLYFPIILNEDATAFVDYMNKNDIAVRRYYTAVHGLTLYKNKFKELNLDFTNSIKEKIVSLPIHTEMSDSELNYLFTTVENYFN